MGKLLVDVDREALERVRVKLGARSHAETLRKLIEAEDSQWSAADIAAMKARGPAPPLVINRIAAAADTSRAKVTNPGKPKVPYGSLLKKR